MARPTKSFLHEDAFELEKRIPIGSKLVRQDARGHWMARTPFGRGVKSRRVYVGPDANKAILEQKWAIVAAARGATLARTSAEDVVEVPILESPQQVLSFAAGGRAGRRRPKE